MASHQTRNILAHPSPGDEVVISGISGYFPKCDSVMELQEKLFNKEDLITDNAYGDTFLDTLERMGKINKLDKFDGDFFGIGYFEGHTQEPIARLLLERTYEAIIDAGINPMEFHNTRTGVYIGICFIESEKKLMYDQLQTNDNGIVGCSRGTLAVQISEWLKVTGPVCMVDTACSSSLFALELAYKAIREGRCDSAIVGAGNLNLHTQISDHFKQLNVMSIDGKCKSFDNSGNGYVRSEAITTCILQRSKDARRIYAKIVHSKTNCDGFTEQGITYPAAEIQRRLLEETYEECVTSPQEVEFMECHGTGTRVGDPQELAAIDAVMCPGRTRPLLIGSVKSNLGHTEPAAALCSLAKVCIAYNSGYIPPNIHFRKCREDIPALTEGRLQVVTEKYPWNRGLTAITSLGFGGANAHLILKNIAREKENNGLPKDDLPRLVCVSARTHSAVDRILSSLAAKPVDVEEVRLWHSIHEHNIEGHGYRGYILLGSESALISKDIISVHNLSPKICFVYSDKGEQWNMIISQFMKISIFAASITKCHEVLRTKGIDLIRYINMNCPKSDSINSIVMLTAFQIGVTNMLSAVGIKPDFIIGCGASEIVCAYADGCLTLEQTILVSYYRGMASLDAINFEHTLPCGNAEIASAEVFYNVFNELIDKEMRTNQLSSNIANIGLKLLESLREIINPQNVSSKRWLLTKTDEDRRIFSKSVSSSLAEYYTENFLKSITTKALYGMVPTDSVILEITSQEVLKDTNNNYNNVTHVHLEGNPNANKLDQFFRVLGELFQTGLNPHLANIYPYVSYPVSQGTPMLSHLVEWNHKAKWFTESTVINTYKCSSIERTVKISLEDNKYLSGHVIDERIIYPGSGYLVLVWETLAHMMQKPYKELSVVFENVCFERSTVIPKTGHLEMIISIHHISGDFEITERDSTVATGRIYSQSNISINFNEMIERESEECDNNTPCMKSADFYKMFRLRGFGHRGDFQGIKECNVRGTHFKIAWINNWVVFLDSLLHTFMIASDTKNVLLPTRIEKLSIDTKLHYDALQVLPEPKMVTAYGHKYLNTTKTAGVSLSGVHCTPITKKIANCAPILEKHVFDPLEGISITMVEDALRVTVQLILENLQACTIKGLEVIDEEYKHESYNALIQTVLSILQDQLFIHSELSVITNDEINMPPSISISDKIEGHKNITFVIAAKLCERLNVLKQCENILGHKGFIVTREGTDFQKSKCPESYDIISLKNIGNEYLVLLRKKEILKEVKFIEIKARDENFSWIDAVKDEINKDGKLVIYSMDECSGLLGFINCLRKEPRGEKVHGILVKDKLAPYFDPKVEFYRKQLQKNLVINVYEDGQWGTYRHLKLKSLDQTVPVHHAYNNIETIGDLSTLKWYEGSLDKNAQIDPQTCLVYVYCAALNFRDVMTATGRVTVDAVCRRRIDQECVQGLEVVGKTANGTRVMCMPEKGISNMALCHKNFVMAIPDEWSFEEAATVFVAYSTVYTALVVFGKIKRGESVLIHAGTGAVGQAGIHVALSYGCEVFTTVGNDEKRAFIKKLFPQIKDTHIGCSRDTSFEAMIQRETKGKGVDVALNSLADEILQATARCLAHGGRFLEIGKFDIFKNTPVEMYLHQKEISFHGVMLDFLNEEKCSAVRTRLLELLTSGIASGAVRPLTYCKFEKDEVEAAFRYMASGKHIGKVIIKFRDEEPLGINAIPKPLKIDAVKSYTCQSHKVYILVGGLGGFGLELANWLILRGARKLLLVSRNGVTNGYQAYKLSLWKSYGVDIKISTNDVTNENGCKLMLEMANALGQVEAVFNLAVVLNDMILQHQNSQTFGNVYAPKASVAFHLDKLTRKLCPNLKDFVMFSSFSSGRGNAGQTNYGLANSVMERICEKRKKEGLPALAIQWGAIGDVGILTEIYSDPSKITRDVVLQSIQSCLRTIDKFLNQDDAIVSSYLPIEKETRSKQIKTAVDTVAVIMGIKDLKTISSQTALANLGMDSMVAMEVKQTLERNFGIFLSAKETRTLTFAKLTILSSDGKMLSNTPNIEKTKTDETKLGFRVFINTLGDASMADDPFINMPTASNKSSAPKAFPNSENIIFMIPGIESSAITLEPLCRKLEVNACVLQLGTHNLEENIPSMVDRLYETLMSKRSPNMTFNLLGYSYGTILVLELAAKLEAEGWKGTVFCIDGSPLMIKSIQSTKFSRENETAFNDNLLRYLIDMIIVSEKDLAEALIKLEKIDSNEDKLDYILKLVPNSLKYSHDYVKLMAKAIYHRIKVLDDFNDNVMKQLESPVILIRSDIQLPSVPENYGLDKVTKKDLAIYQIKSDHLKILESDECANILNTYLNKNTTNS